MNFREFKKLIQTQFDSMKDQTLFTVNLDKDKLWETYLSSFPEGTDPIYKEKTTHDCNCCKSFIRAVGNIVCVTDKNELVSIWDIESDSEYGIVAEAMSKFVKSKKVQNLFFHESPEVGVDSNIKLLENKDTIRFEHFYLKLPNKFVNKDPGAKLSRAQADKDVFKRSLEEITLDSAMTVLELIDQNSLYRGEEHKGAVETFIKYKKQYDKVVKSKKDIYTWITSQKAGSAVSRVRNSAIGTLLVDISNGVELDGAVRSFESKVAPMNYKRPSALITKSMIDNAKKKINELGFETALARRYANINDVTINNVIFANRNAKKVFNKDVFDELSDSIKTKEKKFDKIEEISIETFINDVLPKSKSIEIMAENRHSNNFFSLIAPIDPDSKNMFKWDNNFSWCYNGEVTDSIKERVKKAGGNVDGDVCCRLSWDNSDDLDFHMAEMTSRYEINYGNKGKKSPNGGVLDVDANGIDGIRPNPCENIYYKSKSTIKDGQYKLVVRQYQRRNNDNYGFQVEVDILGEVYHFEHSKMLKDKESVFICDIIVKDGNIMLKPILESTTSSKEIWGVKTNEFRNVSMIMNSPNHWDGNKTGNKHYFFVLEGCKNEDSARGFFNEFLKEDLNEHRKVFEVLGSRMKAEYSDDQLGGLGFSSTQKNSIVAKVTGSFTRLIKIIF